MVDLTEKLVEMQRSQAELMAKAQSRTEELMLKMEMEQRKLDEESRRRDQEGTATFVCEQSNQVSRKTDCK